MKFSIGQPDYPFRHVGDIRGALIAGQKGRDLKLILLDMEEMREMQAKLPNVRGVPVYVAFDREKQRVWVHPLPKGEYEWDILRAEGTAKPTSTLTLPKKH
jgi:hypothetical protein